ncbi:MAG: protein TolR [Geminicoccaceae bacterium]|nr:protein TolR [Geminicoccaceae bacterium]
MAVTPLGREDGRRRRRRRPLSEINVTPLVDVMLVLLIVFMVTAPLLTTGVVVDLPKARTAPLPGQDEPLTVSIKADSSIWLQDSAIGLEELGPRLAAIRERNPELRVFVRGDRQVDYGRVMAVVSAINQAGIGKVALVTEAPRRTAELARGPER